MDEEWDAFVDRIPGGHHVQSSLWAQVKGSVGWECERVVLRRDGAIVAGAQLLVRRLHRGIKLAFVPRAPLAPDVHLAEAALDALEHAARRERLLYVKVQPPSSLEALLPALAARGYVASRLDAAPTATTRIDLTPDLETIESRMRTNARRNVRRARRLGVQVRVGSEPELPAFHRLLRETGQRKGFTPYPDHYFEAMWRAFAARGRGALLLAEQERQVVASSLVVAVGDTAACKMAVGSIGGDGARATELIHLAGMGWARERGYHFYDLDGINPELARRWDAGDRRPGQGVGHFKLGLGGEVVTVPGAWDRSFHPLVGPIARRAAPRLEAWGPVTRRLLGRAS